MTDLLCPYVPKEINATASRVNAFTVLLLLILNAFTGFVIIASFLIIDFFLKAFFMEKFTSPLAGLSLKIANFLKLKAKMKNAGPKIFAAKIGLTMSILILAFGLAGFTYLSIATSLIFMTFVTIESLTGFCFGCYTYTFYVKFFKRI